MSRPSRLDATDRVNLLLSFVPYLIEHSPVPVNEIARVFDTSTDSVRELIRLMAVSGIPGETGMYQHQDLFDIDWEAFEKDDHVVLWHHIAVDSTPRLSQREAASLIAGLQYISGLVGATDTDSVERIITKLSRGAHSQPQPITISSGAVPEEVALLNMAISGNHSVEFVYSSQGSTDFRRVDPIRLDLVGTHWYLRGWCHLREGVRTFRLSRMSELVLTEVERTTTVTPDELPDELFSVTDGLISVTCSGPSHVLSSIAEFQPSSVQETSESAVRFTVELASLSTVISLVAGTGGVLTVVSPREARQVVEEWTRRALSYQLQEAGSA